MSRALLRLVLCAALPGAMLLLPGCGALVSSRRQLNPGAELGIYVGTTQYMWERSGANRAAGDGAFSGLYDPEDGSVTISEQVRGWGVFTVPMHELGIHAFDHQKPRDMVELLRRYESPSFSFGFHSDEDLAEAQEYLDTVPDPLAVKRALEAGRSATLEAKP